MKLKAGVDNSITRQINIEWYIVIPKGILIKGIKTIIGKLVVIQCTIDLIKIIVSIGLFDKMYKSSVPSSKSS